MFSYFIANSSTLRLWLIGNLKEHHGWIQLVFVEALTNNLKRDPLAIKPYHKVLGLLQYTVHCEKSFSKNCVLYPAHGMSTMSILHKYIFFL